ncbi:chromosome partitioning protein ParA [Solitalea longa]|uniref:Chromosome partitioning protein ParA n=1 Tax=Solitalea longa TaxID=2079460 RepID=A0A2S4ZWZ8_9SPHI|nr:ROK family protein [Solitalea longa]POY34894.1 chromosome partitioning protein ParA [Solitalea longa]
MNILSIDIGGSNIKATILDADGVPISEYGRMPTPDPANPENVLELIRELVQPLGEYDKISVGFPGYVKNGVIKTAPNLGTEDWEDYDLQSAIAAMLDKPTKVVNDADLQGIGMVSGQGLEMMITLGTGFGTALLLDGKLLPHFEISHHPIKTDKDYDDYVGEKAYQRRGKDHWNYRMKKVLAVLKTVFNYDRLYISGGNAKNLAIELDDNIIIVNNREGIKGGARLWAHE